MYVYGDRFTGGRKKETEVYWCLGSGQRGRERPSVMQWRCGAVFQGEGEQAGLVAVLRQVTRWACLCSGRQWEVATVGPSPFTRVSTAPVGGAMRPLPTASAPWTQHAVPGGWSLGPESKPDSQGCAGCCLDGGGARTRLLLDLSCVGPTLLHAIVQSYWQGARRFSFPRFPLFLSTPRGCLYARLCRALHGTQAPEMQNTKAVERTRSSLRLPAMCGWAPGTVPGL